MTEITAAPSEKTRQQPLDAAAVANEAIAKAQGSSAAEISASQIADEAIAKAAGKTPQDNSTPPATPRMEGYFNRHTSGYWAVMVPALSLRYLPEAFAKIGVGRAEVVKKVAGEALTKLKGQWDMAYGTITGALMMGVTTFYMHHTYKDIKNIFAEPIAAETGKKPEDVGMRDIWNSDNSLVKAARRNFVKYNMRRYTMNLPFFAGHAVKGLSGDAAVGLGVATNSAYLVHDVFRRKETFFEHLQVFITQKIQHTDQLGDKISAVDLINLYELHLRDQDHSHQLAGRMDTQEWDRKEKIFGRMADLMNQTYGNQKNKERANFTLSEMIYLMGHGMIDSSNPDRSCALIEVANCNGIQAVKDVVANGAANGGEVKYAKERYLSQPHAHVVAPQETKPQFASKFANAAGMSKTEQVTGRMSETPATQAL